MARVMDERCVDELRVAEDGLMQEKKTMNRPSGVIDGNQASVSNAMTIEVVGTHPAGAPMHVSTRNTSDRPSSSPSTRVFGTEGLAEIVVGEDDEPSVVAHRWTFEEIHAPEESAVPEENVVP